MYLWIIFILTQVPFQYVLADRQIPKVPVSDIKPSNLRTKGRQKFRIKVEYDQKLKKLSHFNRIENEIVGPAVKFWSDTLAPKIPNSNIIHIPRDCKLDAYTKFKGKHVCSEVCEEITKCMDAAVPKKYIDQCYSFTKSKKIVTTGTKGAGLKNYDFILLVNGDKDFCDRKNEKSYSKICVKQEKDDRPILGVINICTDSQENNPINFPTIKLIKHELAHVLAFSSELFEYFRYSNSTPRTPRNIDDEPTYHQKENYQYSLESNTLLLKNVSRMLFSTKEFREVIYLITPAVKKLVQYYFNCSTAIGAPLDTKTANHFDERIFMNEIMASANTHFAILSNLTLAVMEDSGWYTVDYSKAEPFEATKTLGCDFLKKSCYEYTSNRRGEDLRPYCETHQNDLYCSQDLTRVTYCSLSITQDKTSPPQKYRYLNNKSLVASNAAREYCPIYENFKKCSSDKFSPKNVDENKLAEYFGKNSRCIQTFGSISYKRQSIKKSSSQGAGCYKVKCTNHSSSYFIYVYSQKLECQTHKQDVYFNVTIQGVTFTGTLICPLKKTVCAMKYDPDEFYRYQPTNPNSNSTSSGSSSLSGLLVFAVLTTVIFVSIGSGFLCLTKCNR